MVIFATLLVLFQAGLLCGVQVLAQTSTNITATRPVVQARAGSRAILRCSLPSDFPPDTEFFWRKDDGTTVAVGRSVTYRPERYSTRKSSRSYSLQIRPAGPMDSGAYYCGYEGDGVVKEALVNLTVMVPPNFDMTASITARNSEYRVRVNSSGSMSCRFRPPWPSNIQHFWRKEDGTRLATGTTVVLDPERISARKSTFSPSYSIKIKNVQPSDSGAYFCGFDQNGTVGEARINLVVMEPPQILGDESSRFSLTARRGSDVDITCAVAGTPTPDITWLAISYHNGPEYRGPVNVEVGQGQVLTLHNVQRSNVTFYRCVADNGVKPTTSKLFSLTVTDAPIVQVPSPTASGDIGRNILLECTILSSPMGQSDWTFHGQVLTNSSKYEILTRYTAADTVKLSLKIRSIAGSDFGRYVCQTSNALGTAERDVQLSRIVQESRRELSIPLSEVINAENSGAKSVL